MKQWVLRGLLLAGFLAAGIWVWGWLFPSPERIIRKQLAGLATAATIAPNEAPLAKLINAQKVAGFFTGDVQIVIDIPGHARHTLSGQDDLVKGAGAARNSFDALNVRFLDVQVSVLGDSESAVTSLTAEAQVPGQRDFMVQELKLNWRKQGRHWLIDRVETVKTLL